MTEEETSEAVPASAGDSADGSGDSRDDSADREEQDMRKKDDGVFGTIDGKRRRMWIVEQRFDGKPDAAWGETVERAAEDLWEYFHRYAYSLDAGDSLEGLLVEFKTLSAWQDDCLDSEDETAHGSATNGNLLHWQIRYNDGTVREFNIRQATQKDLDEGLMLVGKWDLEGEER